MMFESLIEDIIIARIRNVNKFGMDHVFPDYKKCGREYIYHSVDSELDLKVEKLIKKYIEA